MDLNAKINELEDKIKELKKEIKKNNNDSVLSSVTITGEVVVLHSKSDSIEDIKEAALKGWLEDMQVMDHNSNSLDFDIERIYNISEIPDDYFSMTPHITSSQNKDDRRDCTTILEQMNGN